MSKYKKFKCPFCDTINIGEGVIAKETKCRKCRREFEVREDLKL